MNPFEWDLNPGRVIFGSGSIDKLPDAVKRLNVSSPLLLSTPRGIEHTNRLADILRSASIESVGAFNNAVTHTPVAVTEEALQLLKAKSADCVISIGGGSVVGLGKALSVRTGVPHICIPTTYAGSEVTPILGETDGGKKTTRTGPEILPAIVIYDVRLTMTLPPAICATSGVNAIAHSVEALYARNSNPIISLMAREGISALAEALPQIIQDPTDGAARERALYGAWLCGTCLGSSAMAIHHKLCHTLGGLFGLPHAETHTIILPHALSYNAPAIPAQMRELATALPGSGGDALKGLNLLLDKLHAPRALKDFGMKESDIDHAAEVALSMQYPNPRPIEKEAIRELLRRAWAGEPARADL
jgi:alcohol dehydrogenase class IV